MIAVLFIRTAFFVLNDWESFGEVRGMVWGRCKK